MHRIDLELGLRPLSAWHVGTGYGLAGVVDARTARTGEGTVYIPGSTVKGRLRFRFRLVMDTLGIAGCQPGHPCKGPDARCPVCNVFGSIRQAGSLFFSDVHLVDSQSDLARLEGGRFRPLFEHETRTNVMVSRLRGVAFEQRLFTTEAGAPELYLVGAIQGSLPAHGRTLTLDGQSVPQDVGILVTAIRTVTHIGGRKSRGLGRCRLEVRDLAVDDRPVAVPSLLDALLE